MKKEIDAFVSDNPEYEKWMLKEYKHPWFTLSTTVVLESINIWKQHAKSRSKGRT